MTVAVRGLVVPQHGAASSGSSGGVEPAPAVSTAPHQLQVELASEAVARRTVDPPSLAAVDASVDAGAGNHGPAAGSAGPAPGRRAGVSGEEEHRDTGDHDDGTAGAADSEAVALPVPLAAPAGPGGDVGGYHGGSSNVGVEDDAGEGVAVDLKKRWRWCRPGPDKVQVASAKYRALARACKLLTPV